MLHKHREIQFILELSKIKTYNKTKLVNLINQGLDYPFVLGHLLYHRIAGAAYVVLKETQLFDQMNREFRNTLQTIYSYNCVKQNSFKESMNSLCVMLEQITIPYALLKGAFLVDVYDKGIRTSNDIDILVNHDNISEITNVLKQNGFRQGNIRSGEFVEASRFEILASRINRGETVPFIKKIDLPQMPFLEIDINFSFDYQAQQKDSTVSEFLHNSQSELCVEKGLLRTLDITHFLIHLCLHLYKEATVLNWVKMGRDSSLYKYMDIYVIIYEFLDQDFSKRFIELVKYYQMERECFYALYYTKILFDIKNLYLNEIIDYIKPAKLEYLSYVFDPETKKEYRFNNDYSEWVFLNRKVEYLYEVNDE